MYPVAKGDILKKTSYFTLRRGPEVLSIGVDHILTGPAPGRFLSDAYLEGVLISEEYWGEGTTEQTALRDLLTKIKEIPFRDLLPPGIPLPGAS